VDRAQVAAEVVQPADLAADVVQPADLAAEVVPAIFAAPGIGSNDNTARHRVWTRCRAVVTIGVRVAAEVVPPADPGGCPRG
jgi:hypothetical protein